MDITPEQVRLMVTGMITLVLSIAVHEFGHAIVAHKLGDDTPSRQGRVTLNPVAHADPIGTLILPLVGMIFTAGAGGVPYPGFGWGKPVEHQPRNFTRKISMVTGQMLVALAGPMMNILFGTVIAAVHVGLLAAHVNIPHQVQIALVFAVSLNYLLFFFNMLPVPPLDGGWIIQRFIPYKHRRTFDHYQIYAPFVFMAIVFIPQFRFLFATPANWITEHVYHWLGLAFGVPL